MIFKTENGEFRFSGSNVSFFRENKIVREFKVNTFKEITEKQAEVIVRNLKEQIK